MATVFESTRPRWSMPGVLLLLAVLSGGYTWTQIAIPALGWDASAAARHGSHFLATWVHAVGGTLMLFSGAAALYIGSTKRFFRYHRYVGYTYVTGGALGAGTALAIALANPHQSVASASATGTLALAWLFATFMAWRSARNRRFDTHRPWMIRSYVLTWTFVFCRLLGTVPAVASAGKEVEHALLWLTWVLPMMICEVALQWHATSRNPAGLTPGR
jgi:hypothetical protein